MVRIIRKLFSAHGETIQHFSWRLLQTAGKQGIVFLIFIVCAKTLTPYDFGIYNYVLNAVFFLIMFGDFGISTAASKYIAEYAILDEKKLRAVLVNASGLILVITVVVTILGLVFGRVVLQEKAIFAFYLLPMLFLAPMTSLYDGVYRGLRKFKQLAIISSVVGVAAAMLVYPCVQMFGLKGALLFQNGFYLILLTALAFGYRNFDIRFDKMVLKEVGSYSLVYGLAVAGNYLFLRFGILILGHYGYLGQIAIYELINKIFLVLVIPFTMLGQVVAPNFSQLSASNQVDRILRKLKSYTLIFLGVGVILGVAAYVVTPVVVRWFFPQYFTNDFLKIFPFSVLILVTNVWAGTIDAGIVVPTGSANLMAKFYLSLGIVSSILGLFLTQRIGYMGVIYSFAISNTVMVIGLRILFFRKLYLYNARSHY